MQPKELLIIHLKINNMKKKKTPPKAKEPIKIRFKELSNGNQSIYLDYYNNGKRQYDFLKLYLVPETNPIDKITNAQTRELAEKVKTAKINELNHTAHGFQITNTKQKARLIDYLQAIADEKKQAVGNVTKG